MLKLFTDENFIYRYLPPRECGIATFTMDLYNSMVKNNKSGENSSDGFIVAMNDHGLTYDYPEEVKFTIRQEHQRDYLEAAKYINLSGADICILEHDIKAFEEYETSHIKRDHHNPVSANF